MSTKQKAIIVCDYCGKEIPGGTGVYCSDVSHEGCSEINHNGKTFYVTDGMDFCSIDCLVTSIRDVLTNGIILPRV